MSQQRHTQEPVAMIHAEWLERSMIIGAQEAAAELRRLHEVEKQRDTLLAALESVLPHVYEDFIAAGIVQLIARTKGGAA